MSTSVKKQAQISKSLRMFLKFLLDLNFNLKQNKTKKINSKTEWLCFVKKSKLEKKA